MLRADWGVFAYKMCVCVCVRVFENHKMYASRQSRAHARHITHLSTARTHTHTHTHNACEQAVTGTCQYVDNGMHAMGLSLDSSNFKEYIDKQVFLPPPPPPSPHHYTSAGPAPSPDACVHAALRQQATARTPTALLGVCVRAKGRESAAARVVIVMHLFIVFCVCSVLLLLLLFFLLLLLLLLLLPCSMQRLFLYCEVWRSLGWLEAGCLPQEHLSCQVHLSCHEHLSRMM